MERTEIVTATVITYALPVTERVKVQLNHQMPVEITGPHPSTAGSGFSMTSLHPITLLFDLLTSTTKINKQ